MHKKHTKIISTSGMDKLQVFVSICFFVHITVINIYVTDIRFFNTERLRHRKIYQSVREMYKLGPVTNHKLLN